MKEINYKANMLQMEALNLTYSTMIIVNQRESKSEQGLGQKDKAELRRESQEMKNPQNKALQFPLYT